MKSQEELKRISDLEERIGKSKERLGRLQKIREIPEGALDALKGELQFAIDANQFMIDLDSDSSDLAPGDSGERLLARVKSHGGAKRAYKAILRTINSVEEIVRDLNLDIARMRSDVKRLSGEESDVTKPRRQTV